MYYQNQFSEVYNSPHEAWNLINSML